MEKYIFIYLLEVIVFILTWIIGILVFKLKYKEGLAKFLGVSSFIFIGVFLTTLFLEKPNMSQNTIKNIEVKTQSKVMPPETFYHFKNVTNDIKVTDNIDYNKIGKYEINYKIDTMFGTYTESAIVNVVDTTAPDIVLEGNEEYSQSYAKEYSEPGYKAIDLYDGDVTNNVEVLKEELNEYEYNIIYRVQDSSGNKAEKIRHVIICDDVPPNITLNGKANIYITLNANYEEQGATAVDEIDGDLSNKIAVEGSVDTSKEGVYSIKYTVSDSRGNEATKTRVVNVFTPTTIVAHDGSNGNKGVIYLTFDDGPSSSTTPHILDVLKKKNVKATFFILNYDAVGEQLVKREVEEGHTVAIHGYSHKYGEIYQSVDTYMNNITKLQEKVRASTGGYNATVTRFPGGSSNTISRKYSVGIMTKLCQEMLDRGYTYFDWNVDSNDAGSAKTPDDVYNNVTSALKKSRQNVVLMHDFSGNTKTLEALERIIDYGLANGYTFDKITEQTPMVTHKPNN